MKIFYFPFRSIFQIIDNNSVFYTKVMKFPSLALELCPTWTKDRKQTLSAICSIKQNSIL